tara:strand:+ start:279 stop:665 length:387 start_codon:yes stop_codon:yes gene_type:complete
MASELKVNTLTGVSTAGSIAVTAEGNSTTTNLQQGLAKSTIHYDQDNNTIRDSFNVSSNADSAAGLWTYTVTNAYSNIYWQPVWTSAAAFAQINAANTTTVGSFRSRDATASNSDSTIQVVQGTGDLA